MVVNIMVSTIDLIECNRCRAMIMDTGYKRMDHIEFHKRVDPDPDNYYFSSHGAESVVTVT